MTSSPAEVPHVMSDSIEQELGMEDQASNDVIMEVDCIEPCEDAEVNSNVETGIHCDDIAVQILSRLDKYAYQQAVSQDARSINENYLFPLHFPWNTRHLLPKKFLKTMPRDIDELFVITHCDDSLHSPYGDFNGLFCFGRYENGQSKGNYGNALKQSSQIESISLKLESDTIAAARRSEDPGVIELFLQMPLPPSIDSVNRLEVSENNLSLTDKWNAYLWADADRAETLSHMPFNWGMNKVVPSALEMNDGQNHLHNFFKIGSRRTPFATDLYADDESTFRNCNVDNSQEIRKLTKSCLRKWKISAKVSSVSTRSTLFPLCTVVNGESSENSIRRVIRPMLTSALLPPEVQTGQTVLLEKSLELDGEGFAYILGSYDCRFSERALTLKKDGISRGKKVEIGRNRLIWTSIIQGTEPFIPSTRNRIAYNSLITGHRIDQSKVLRPREVKVGVKVEGSLIVEEAPDYFLTNSNNGKKRKHSMRHGDYDIHDNKSSMERPITRSDEEVEQAFSFSLAKVETLNEKRLLAKSKEDGAVVYLDMDSQAISPLQINRNDIIASLLKFNQIKQRKSKYNTVTEPIEEYSKTGVLKDFMRDFLKGYAPPRFACLPLEDGLLRMVCMTTGKMPGSAVHNVIREVCQSGIGTRCSVCWSDVNVEECSKCGLLAHPTCCLDMGQFKKISDVLLSSKHLSENKIDKGQENIEISDIVGQMDEKDEARSQDLRWQCAVCSLYFEKPRRIARLPSRFTDGDNRVSATKVDGSKNVPGPRCSLCPHRGGAMSPIEPSAYSSSDSLEWTHEVCRVWSCSNLPDNENSKSRPFHQYPKLLSGTCALCGVGTLKRSKMDNTISHSFSGLTKCAAHGCFVAFHPMCAILASNLNMGSDGQKTSGAITRLNNEEKASAIHQEHVEADKVLCNEYTLQLVKLIRTESSSRQNKKVANKEVVIPVAFCGLHNPGRNDSFYGFLPGGGLVKPF